ncbi:hypothetical protein Scep_026248 [Stephania cephalantha]|uniref:Uncharacterized protein n=1 Tax=Stephania cephalantha TaxID=152367 RepID=A0AAP0ETN7_9MAGN
MPRMASMEENQAIIIQVSKSISSTCNWSLIRQEEKYKFKLQAFLGLNQDWSHNVENDPCWSTASFTQTR